MEPFGVLMKPCAEEDSETWEVAELEESMKKLISDGEDCCTKMMNEGISITLQETSNMDYVASQENGMIASAGVDQVDTFLREALENNRDRLTILRLEQEVQKFLRNPKQQQLEFQPMASSYHRLAAHRVAQHYFCQSTVIESSEGTRIVALKTPQSRYPSIRLSDIPVKYIEEDKVVPSILPAKVAIKQRPRKNSPSGMDMNNDGRNGGGLNPAKSMEERKEEYNKARARIFNDDIGKFSEEMYEEVDVEKDFDYQQIQPSKVEEVDYKGFIRSANAEINQFSCGSRPNTKVEKENLSRIEKDAFCRSKINGNRVAIFRDREKDKRDPDYDRSYERYSQRFEPGFGMNVALGIQPMCIPAANYDTQFPHLGAHNSRQVHVEQSVLRPLVPQHMHSSWVTPLNNFRPPEAVRPYGNGQISPQAAMSFFMHAPQFMYPGPAMSYIHQHEQFQHSLYQPHMQPAEASLCQARRS